jgi:trehalose 6-phosphate phosphatase
VSVPAPAPRPPPPPPPLLPVPVTSAGVDGLRAIVAAPSRALVGLDFDGTLSPIVADPASARPHDEAAGVLRQLAEALGTVAIVTGRPPQIVVNLLGLATPPPTNVLVVGHYGLESWTPATGVVRLAGVEVGRIDEARTALPALLSDLAAPAGTDIEDKGASVAVHVRRTDDPQAALELLWAPLAALAADTGLRLEPGRMVLELRPPGIDKGDALESLVRGRRANAVCYIGDDAGDLPAFDALERLRSLGLPTLAVCSGSPEVTGLAASVDLVVGGPDGVLAFLKALIGALASTG